MAVQSTPTNGKAVASMVLGIIAAVLIFVPYGGFVGLVLAIIGLVMGVQAKKQAPSGMATAGIVLCIIALAIDAIAVIVVAACASALGAAGCAMANAANSIPFN